MCFLLKFNKYICYELNKVYQEVNLIFVLRSSKKSPGKKSMNLKDLHGNSVV